MNVWFNRSNAVLVEVEAIINSRPLPYLYSDNINGVLSSSHLVLLLMLLDNIVHPEEIDDTPEVI